MPGLPRAIIKKYGITKKAWAIFRGRGGSSSPNRRKTRRAPGRSNKRGGFTARRSRSRRSNGIGGFGGLASSKNLLGTIAGAYLAPKMGISPQLGAAAGSYLYGKKGVTGAAVGYFAAPYLLGLLRGVTGGNGGTAAGPSWEF